MVEAPVDQDAVKADGVHPDLLWKLQVLIDRVVIRTFLLSREEQLST